MPLSASGKLSPSTASLRQEKTCCNHFTVLVLPPPPSYLRGKKNSPTRAGTLRGYVNLVASSQRPNPIFASFVSFVDSSPCLLRPNPHFWPKNAVFWLAVGQCGLTLDKWGLAFGQCGLSSDECRPTSGKWGLPFGDCRLTSGDCGSPSGDCGPPAGEAPPRPPPPTPLRGQIIPQTFIRT